jgi:hypothetical protein
VPEEIGHLWGDEETFLAEAARRNAERFGKVV